MFPNGIINIDLLKSPWNWPIVFIFATIWLLFFHVVMQMWTAMMAPAAQPTFGGPGQVGAQSASTSQFSQPGNLASDPGSTLSGFAGESGTQPGWQMWTDGWEAKYAEDGFGGTSI